MVGAMGRLNLERMGILKWVLALRMSTALWRRPVTSGELGDLAETGRSRLFLAIFQGVSLVERQGKVVLIWIQRQHAELED